MMTPHHICNCEIIASVGRVMLLAELDSPFARSAPGEIAYHDLAIALYVLAEGPRAARPALAYRCAMEEIRALDIDDLEAYGDAINRMADKWASFAAEAMEHYEDVISIPARDVTESIQYCINQTLEAAEKL